MSQSPKRTPPPNAYGQMYDRLMEECIKKGSFDYTENGINYAHPFEVIFSRFMQENILQARYESVGFKLYDESSRNFTPDFLIDFPNGRYALVELTTLKTPLMIKKRRKAERFRQRYPGIDLFLVKYKKGLPNHKGRIIVDDGTESFYLIDRSGKGKVSTMDEYLYALLEHIEKRVGQKPLQRVA